MRTQRGEVLASIRDTRDLTADTEKELVAAIEHYKELFADRRSRRWARRTTTTSADPARDGCGSPHVRGAAPSRRASGGQRAVGPAGILRGSEVGVQGSGSGGPGVPIPCDGRQIPVDDLVTLKAHNGKSQRTEGPDTLGPEHAEDHADDGDGRHVQAEACAGPGGSGAAVRRAAAGGDRAAADARAGGALPAAAAAGDRASAPR